MLFSNLCRFIRINKKEEWRISKEFYLDTGQD